MSSTLFAPPRSREFTSAGTVLGGAKLYFYVTGTTTPAQTYTNVGLTAAHTHPVVADTGGLFPAIWLSSLVTYDVTLKNSAGATQWSVTGYSEAITAAEVGQVIYPRTANEIAASVTPTAYQYPSGDVRRYGVVGDATTDDTTAFLNACKGSGAHAWVYVPAHLDCLVSGSIVNTTVAAYAIGQTWYGGGRIRVANGFNFNVFDLVGITDFTVLRLRGLSGTLGASISTATARFFNVITSSHRCKLLYSHITGFQSAARVHTSDHCQVIGNDIITPYGWGVNVQTDADDCLVSGNRINGVAGEHGIYVSGTASNNIRAPIITNNHVTGCAIDGIKTTYADDTTIADNKCWSNVGQGIYVTVGSNRSDVHHNTVWLNGEAGILVYDSTTTSDRNVVSNNTVRKNDRNGIFVSSLAPGAVTNTKVQDNDVDDNDQEATSTYYGITVSAATTTGTTVSRNRVTNETAGIFIGTGVVSAVVDANEFASNTANITDNGTTTVIRNYDKSSYTGTLTGIDSVQTGSINYSLNGDVVTLVIPAISGTSNTTAATVTGMPAAIRPSAAQTVMGITTDNGTTAFGKIIVETSGVLTLHVAQSATFTNPGTKGIAAASVSYRLT